MIFEKFQVRIQELEDLELYDFVVNDELFKLITKYEGKNELILKSIKELQRETKFN